MLINELFSGKTTIIERVKMGRSAYVDRLVQRERYNKMRRLLVVVVVLLL